MEETERQELKLRLLVACRFKKFGPCNWDLWLPPGEELPVPERSRKVRAGEFDHEGFRGMMNMRKDYHMLDLTRDLNAQVKWLYPLLKARKIGWNLSSPSGKTGYYVTMHAIPVEMNDDPCLALAIAADKALSQEKE